MMKTFVILSVLIYAVAMGLFAYWYCYGGANEESDASDTERKPLVAWLFNVGWTLFAVGVLRGVLLDNWPTVITLMMLSLIIPVFMYSFVKGAIYLLVTVFVSLIAWQLPSTTAKEERVVDEMAKIAEVSNAGGTTDSTVVEDRGQYFIFIEDEDGVRQESYPADIVSGHYINEDTTPIVICHYSELYKRTFWSKERTKFVGRKLAAVDLYVKRWQLMNTF